MTIKEVGTNGRKYQLTREEYITSDKKHTYYFYPRGPHDATLITVDMLTGDNLSMELKRNEINTYMPRNLHLRWFPGNK